MAKKAVVLGAGMIGRAIAFDLSNDPALSVAVADVSQANLDAVSSRDRIELRCVDLSDPKALASVIADADVVAGALPSRIGLQALRTVIGAGKSYCDISFIPEDSLELDDAAKKAGVTAVVDCGVSPGISNMAVAHGVARLEEASEAMIYVGGLPKIRQWPYEYKAPFAPSDVIEEYTRPARFVERGRMVTKPALSEPELIDFPKVGTLEAFNTDGLRSLLTTISIPNMKEKTLRYPGHIELMRAMRETGLFSKDPIEVGGVSVRPLDVTSALLFPKWTYAPGEEEFTILRVEVTGTESSQRIRYVYDLYDEYDAKTGLSSMARTTAFPCAIVARMLASGEIASPGVLPPETVVGLPGLFDRIVEELGTRGVRVEISKLHLD